MADLENDVQEVAEVEEAPEAQEEEITLEKALEWKERLKKAEAKVVEMKKEKKQAPKEDVYLTRQDLELERFIDKNSDLTEYREDIKKHLSKGLTLAQAKLLVENDDKTIENRKKANSMNITANDGSPAKSEFTKSELAEMSQKDYVQAMRMIESGKAVKR